MSAIDRRRGIALLEVLLAVTVLAVAGVGWTMLAAQNLLALRDAKAREAEVVAASRALAGLIARPTSELERMAGRRRHGEFELRVSVAPPGLVHLELHDAESGRLVLQTHLFRPSEQPDAP